MKRKFIYLILLAFVVNFTSCKEDDYAPPSSTLSGNLAYNGEAINVEYNQVTLQLWQFGLGKKAAINAVIDQDGSYSALLFDGTYRAVFAAGNGPFMTKTIDATVKDTVIFDLSGSKTMDYEVIPYYMVRNATFTNAGGVISASCKLDKIITAAPDAKTVERVSLYINKTAFVSITDYWTEPKKDGPPAVAAVPLKKDLPGASITALNTALNATATANTVAADLTLTVPTLTPTQTYVFCRIGLKITGVSKMIYSPVVKVNL